MRINNQDSTLTIAFEENLLSTTVLALRQSLLGRINQETGTREVVVDLSSVTSIDSQGLNLLVGLYRECQRRSWTLRATGAAPDVVRLLSYVNLSALFGLSATPAR